MNQFQKYSQLGTDKRNKLSYAGLKLFFELSKRWQLNIEEQKILLGLRNHSDLNNFKTNIEKNKSAVLTDECLERLSLITGIRKNIELLYSGDRQDLFMKSKNKYFNNQTPLEVMLRGKIDNLVAVRDYLESSRGAHFH